MSAVEAARLIRAGADVQLSRGPDLAAPPWREVLDGESAGRGRKSDGVARLLARCSRRRPLPFHQSAQYTYMYSNIQEVHSFSLFSSSRTTHVYCTALVPLAYAALPPPIRDIDNSINSTRTATPAVVYSPCCLELSTAFNQVRLLSIRVCLVQQHPSLRVMSIKVEAADGTHIEGTAKLPRSTQ